MNHYLENTKELFNKIKSFGFFARIFKWHEILKLAIDANSELQKIDEEPLKLNEEINELKSDIKSKVTEIQGLKDNNLKNEREIHELKVDNKNLTGINSSLDKSLAEYKKIEEKQQRDYEAKIEKLNAAYESVQKDKESLQKQREDEIKERFEDMKLTWKKHEDFVESQIKQICRNNTINYISKEKVPFSGKPDNTIEIADEYVIFDAKSPQNDNLDNFPKYIKTQVEAAKKYVKEKAVKKSIFLVVPTNTIDTINQTHYNLSDYDVFIITNDSLEPIIKSLKKIEEYEFTESLSPEERDDICRLIGAFAHTTKRRIQIDQFFTEKNIELLSSANLLPSDILKKSQEFEKNGKLNPTVEKRAKQIDIKEIEDKSKRIKREAKAKNIDMEQDLSAIEKVPLVKDD